MFEQGGCWGGGRVWVWGVQGGVLGGLGTEGEQSWPLAQPEQQPESLPGESSWGEGENFGLAVDVVEIHLPIGTI